MLLLCTDTLRGYGLNRIFKLAKEAGYDGIDLSVDFGVFDTWNKEYVKELIDEYDMPVHAISTPKQVSPSKIKDIVEMAKHVNARVVILQPPKIHEFKIIAWLKKEIPKLREKNFISIALENAPSGTFLGIFPEHALSNTQDLKKFKHVCLDTARIGENKKDLIRAYSAFKKFLVHIHLSNLHKGKKYSAPQDGILPLESFLAKLKQDKYPGAISMKILPKHVHAGKDDDVIDNLLRFKKYYDKHYKNIKVENDSKED